jgi:uracil-DNA glycosylase
MARPRKTPPAAQAGLWPADPVAPAPAAADNRLTAPADAWLAATAPDWQPLVQAWRDSPAGQGLLVHLAARQAAGATVYPAWPLRALALTPLAAVRVVILGQDPYHGPGQAEGLAFSVPVGVRPPPSLRNIFVEQQRDLGLPIPSHGHLAAWAGQGVLLLNTVLTVEDGQPASHARRGWEALTDALIGAVAAQPRRITFLLWGAHAQAKAALIEARAPGRHLLLQANHPSPLSARRPPVPFIGCGHFSALAEVVPGLDWRLETAVG